MRSWQKLRKEEGQDAANEISDETVLDKGAIGVKIIVDHLTVCMTSLILFALFLELS